MAERLSDAEIRDITKALEDGRPIDDKYRYLIFREARQVELVWNGKSTHVQDVALPFQTIEHIDEPRDEVKRELQQSLFDTSGKRVQGWSNKLIWGVNKYVLSSLKTGAIREEIEANGGIKLIYIDPPFDVGTDFTTTIEIGETEFEKSPTMLEEIAFRDTWGLGEDSFLAMIYERLKLMKDLLSDDGSIFVHCDWRLNSSIRLVLDEIFGKERFVNEIIWYYRNKMGTGIEKRFNKANDTILYYRKTDNFIFNRIRIPRDEPVKQSAREKRDGKNMRARDEFGNIVYELSYDTILNNIWDIPFIGSTSQERTKYPTQKPEKILEHIINAVTNENDIVCDFFVGSGTTAAVAERLNRKWIVSDIGRFAINTTRKRMISVQRELKKEGKDFRSFEVLSVGNYNFESSREQEDFNELVLTGYKAEKLDNSPFHGKKMNHYVVVGPLDLPTSRGYIDEVIRKCIEVKAVEVDILAFEFGMGVVPDAIDDAKNRGVKLNLKIIPREIFDKRAIADAAVKFSDVGYLDARISTNKLEVEVELIDFSIFYSQDAQELTGVSLQKGKSKVVLDEGIIKRISKDKQGITTIENVATSWIDWIDYWAIDFNFEDRQELKLVQQDDGAIEQISTGRSIFDNQWQSFKTRGSRLELRSAKYQYPKAGSYRIAIKVIDVFGNDTTRVFDVKVGK